MESTVIGVLIGIFLVGMGVYLIVNPQFGFKINHLLERNPRQATPQDLRMMRVSGAVCIVIGVLIVAGVLGIIS